MNHRARSFVRHGLFVGPEGRCVTCGTIHMDNSTRNVKLKYNLDCNNTFPIVLPRNGISFGSKPFEKV